jgi:hypothetical protein
LTIYQVHWNKVNYRLHTRKRSIERYRRSVKDTKYNFFPLRLYFRGNRVRTCLAMNRSTTYARVINFQIYLLEKQFYSAFSTYFHAQNDRNSYSSDFASDRRNHDRVSPRFKRSFSTFCAKYPRYITLRNALLRRRHITHAINTFAR